MKKEDEIDLAGGTRRNFLRQFPAAGAALVLVDSAIAEAQAAKGSPAKFKILDGKTRIDIGGRGKEMIEAAYKLGHEYEGRHRGCCRCTVAALQRAIEFVPQDEDLFRTSCCLDGGATPTGIASCGGFTGSGIIIGYLCGTNPFGDTGLAHRLIHRVYEKYKKAYGSVLCKDARKKAKGDCPKVVGSAAMWTTEIILRQFTNYK